MCDKTTKPKEQPEDTASVCGGLLSVDIRTLAQIEVLLERERNRVHEWYAAKLKALREWAKKQPDEVSRPVFFCLANGRSGFDDDVSFASQIQLLKNALHRSEQEVLELRKRVSELER